uniref:Uncharacterized protein n=1 Tax=Anguilla anguilla TaxID=7936 RepID=A0A0E9VY71_ANGAN
MIKTEAVILPLNIMFSSKNRTTHSLQTCMDMYNRKLTNYPNTNGSFTLS